MNLTLKDYVLKTESVVRHVQDRTPGSEFIEKYWGTLDYATARFNSILIKLSQDQIKEAEHKKDIHNCSVVIQRFYDYTKKYEDATWWNRWYYKTILHGLGTNKVPKIKKLYEKLITSNDDK